MNSPSSMGVPSTSSSATTRLKREDFRRTKHDSVFSQWKILIGPSDWENHSMAKEGAEKYRMQNLPNWTSCPGVYELGIAASRPRSGRGARKLDSSSVVPVYLGQADNLRTRLQQYGRDGAHLENGCSNNKSTYCENVASQKGPGLFTDIFSRELPIVYRCAPVNSKKDAEMTERQLLDNFDYAWNKGSNGARRQDDIYKKLDHLAKQSHFSLLAKKFLVYNKKPVGIKIRTCEPCSSKNRSDSSDLDKSTIVSRIFGVKRLQARQVQYGSGDYCTDICGVAIGHGLVCTEPPVEGRKRCAMHKGMRVNGYATKFYTNPADFQDPRFSHSKDSKDCAHTTVDEKFVPTCLKDYCTDICGVVIGHGSVCTEPPVEGRKRCAMHKGMRVNGCATKFNANVADSQDPRLSHSRDCAHTVDEKFVPTCGFILDDGFPCKREPVPRNKRCLEHKGRRVRS